MTYRSAAGPTRFAALALAAALVGCGEAPVRHDVEIGSFRYSPDVVAAAPGDTVVWTNRDIVPHTVSSEDGSLESGTIVPGASWRFVVPAQGTVPYMCTFHPTMTGVVDAGRRPSREEVR